MHSAKCVCRVFGAKALVILCDPPWERATGISRMLRMLDFEFIFGCCAFRNLLLLPSFLVTRCRLTTLRKEAGLSG